VPSNGVTIRLPGIVCIPCGDEAAADEPTLRSGLICEREPAVE
jgi:hypothetical protein